MTNSSLLFHHYFTTIPPRTFPPFPIFVGCPSFLVGAVSRESLFCFVSLSLCDFAFALGEMVVLVGGVIFDIYILTGCWFGTFSIFPYIGNNHPNWRSYFSEGSPNHQPVLVGGVIFDIYILSNKSHDILFSRGNLLAIFRESIGTMV